MPALSRKSLNPTVLRQIVSALLVLSTGITAVHAAPGQALSETVSGTVQAGALSGVPAADTAAAHRVHLPLITGGTTASTTKIYWGALVDGQAPSSGQLQPGGAFHTFEAATQKGMSILHWGQPWEMHGAMQPFQTAYFNSTRSRGSIPLIDWGSWALGGGPNQPKYKLSTITAGTHDTYIRQWAQAAKAWGHPFFLRFGWEMNGNWQYPWSAQLNGNQPGDFIQAWRHIHNLFAEVGAENATWVWCPNISGGTTLPYASVYPGDAYVDWTCMDGYNFYNTWLSSGTVFQGSGINWLYNSYQQLLTVAPSKPIMIGETSSLEAGDGGAAKAAWITEMLRQTLPNEMPRIKALVWFNWDNNSTNHATLPIESSSASRSAFAAGIASSYYAANQYSQLSTSPIPPP